MIFVFEIHLKPGRIAAEYALAWQRASEIIQRAPGALGTRLHRHTDDPNTLLAIASWESKAARDARDTFLNPDAAMHTILDAHTAIADFKIIGEFEDPDWVVHPKHR